MTNNTASPPPEIGNQRIYRITESIIIFSLVMYALFAPHSIAITQGSFLLGLLAWAVQMVATRRFPLKKSPLDIALLGFFACAVISSFLSYDPYTSIKGLRSPAFFLAFYFVSNKVTSLKFARMLAVAIVASCLFNVAYSAGQLAVGRGLRIDSLTPHGPFARAGLQVGDVITEADGKSIATLEDLSAAVDAQRGRITITYQKDEAVNQASVSRRAIKKLPLEGVERLGLTASPGRSFRITGLYSHYETYAEVLQIIASLAIGLLIAQPDKRSARSLFLGVSIILITAALVLTSTRAAMAGLGLATMVMAVISLRRRTMIAAVLGLLLLVPAAILALEHSRGSQIFNPNEGSTAYRIEVWGEAMGLIKNNPVVGIGKGSEGILKEKLGLFDNGRLPQGHFHSTPVQIATWWGLPALAFYFAMMAILLFESWKLSKRLRAEGRWQDWGVVLGGIGAITAFNLSSLVHFNFGDGEVVMAFWLMAGLVFAIRRLTLEAPTTETEPDKSAMQTIERLDKNQPPAQEAAAELNARAAKARLH